MLVSRSFAENCTFFDVVLQCYFSLDLMPKLISDNSIQDLNLVTFAGQSFLYDPEFIADEFLSNDTLKNNYNFCTGELKATIPPTKRSKYLLIDHLNSPDEVRYETILTSEADNKFLV